MPRANRYIVAGHAYHVTHRCHNRSFLFRFARDREEYRRRLRLSLASQEVQLLSYAITSNHTHLLVYAEATESLSGLMQKIEGEFAEYYNIRKRRSGAFWGGRYHATMIDGGDHLWNCMKYMDLDGKHCRRGRGVRPWNRGADTQPRGTDKRREGRSMDSARGRNRLHLIFRPKKRL